MSRSRLRYIKKIAQTFPDDLEKYRFYLKDCVFPRFNRTILGEAICAINSPGSSHHQKMTSYKNEIIEILNEYVKLINKNEYISLKKFFSAIAVWSNKDERIFLVKNYKIQK